MNWVFYDHPWRYAFDHKPTLDDVWPILHEAGYNGRKKNYRLVEDPDWPEFYLRLESNLQEGQPCKWRTVTYIRTKHTDEA